MLEKEQKVSEILVPLPYQSVIFILELLALRM